MSRIGTLWPHAQKVSPVYGAKVTRSVAMGGQLGEHPLAIVFDGGGREVGVLALTEEAARQLAADLVAVLGPGPVSPGPAEKPNVSPGPAEKPAEAKPAEAKPGPATHRRP